MTINIIYLIFYSFSIPNINNNFIVNSIKNSNINSNSNKPYMNFEEINNNDSNKNLINNTHYDENFPSFYNFLREQELKETDEKYKYFKNYENKKKFFNKEKYDNIEQTFKDLKLLTHNSTTKFMNLWIVTMVNKVEYFPKFMYEDMFKMREFCQKNNTKNYFYIGYFPNDSNIKHGPYYIGVFELVPSQREFITHIIIQNPYYCCEKVYNNKKIVDFKNELMAMSSDSMVFFKFSNLKNTSNQRYYYSWLYEE